MSVLRGKADVGLSPWREQFQKVAETANCGLREMTLPGNSRRRRLLLYRFGVLASLAISPSTSVQAFDSWKRGQLLHSWSPFGVS